MKTMISYPPLKGPGSAMLTQNRQFQWYKRASYIYPVVSATAATLLKNDGFEVIWNDCIAQRWSVEQFYDFIREQKPDIIVFESKTPVIKQHWQIINKLKLSTINHQLSTILMGDHVTALPEESMRNSQVDYVITGGDYDRLLLNIAQHIRDNIALDKGVWYREGDEIRDTGAFELNRDLDDLPFIDRRLTNAHLYGEKWKRRTPFFYTMAGRDCLWGRCSFCSWGTLYPKPRVRSPENVLDEIEILIGEHSAREIFDDMGTFPAGEWLDWFCEGMLSRGISKKITFSCNMRFGSLTKKNMQLMKKAGFRKLKMGLESANQSTLDRINKGVKVSRVIDECKEISKEGLAIHLTVMIGYPWETRQQTLKTLGLAKDLMKKGWIEMLQSTVLVPYPGTQLYKEALKEGWFRIDPGDYDRYDMSEPVFNIPDMKPQEITDICSKIYGSFFSPTFIVRNVMNVRSIGDVGYLLRGAASAMGHIADFTRRR